MLGKWLSHADYQQQCADLLTSMAQTNPHSLLEYEIEISKLFITNLDPLEVLISPLYSSRGRPSLHQAEIFRSFILMSELKIPLDKWIAKIANNPVLQMSCGFFDGKLPGVASYYDFIDRIINLDEKPRHKAKKRKPKEKHGKEKLAPRHPGIVAKLVEKILDGRRLNRRPERVLQEIFAKVCVQPSVDLGLVPKTVSVSGDGTCIKTGASPHGVKTCDCIKQGIYNCECNRKFSDPSATWGWDSHNERWFYGYTGYFISTYNKDLKIDLPLYLRLVEAKRHDSISAVVALAEFRDLYPNLNIDTFISDSASDNYATYELLDKWNINAVIALNETKKGNFQYPEHLKLDDNKVPVCPGGHKMVYWGFCGKDRCRLKWRCPRACGKTGRSESCDVCSPSTYGRVIYTKPVWDLRLFSKIPRGSKGFKDKMKERTAAERVNNRILHHYGLENSMTRGKKRTSFLATVAGFNIHLDAQLASLKTARLFDFKSVFGIKIAA